MDKDNFKQKLFDIKNLVAKNLSKEEEEEINIFIDKITEDLQNKLQLIDHKKLSKTIKKIIKENSDV
tara:strand:+ start:366 stop:566 length:201 start_codon:yes stop_codon:yes gene_type:complete